MSERVFFGQRKHDGDFFIAYIEPRPHPRCIDHLVIWITDEKLEAPRAVGNPPKGKPERGLPLGSRDDAGIVFNAFVEGHLAATKRQADRKEEARRNQIEACRAFLAFEDDP